MMAAWQVRFVPIGIQPDESLQNIGSVRKQHSKILHQFARRANQVDFLSSPLAKDIPLNPSGKSKLECRYPVPPEGRRPSSRTLGQVAVDADAMSDECGVKRTAKSCGPDAAVLASSSLGSKAS